MVGGGSLYNNTYNIKLLDEEETRNTIYVASVSEPHKYALLGRGVAEPNNGVFLTKRS